MGVRIHYAFRVARHTSYYSRTIFIDDHVAGIWGIMGSPMELDGQVWLAMSQYAMRFPLFVARLARAELEVMRQGKYFLTTTVAADDETAQRFACFMGFQPADPQGPAKARSRRERNAMVKYLQTTPGLMVPCGQGVQAAMIWRAEAR